MLAVIVPASHAIAAVLPVAQAEPAGQMVHSEAAARSVALENVPAKHGSSTDAPAGQKLPGGQLLPAVEPGTF